MKIFSALLLAMLLSAPVVRSQKHPEKGGHEIEFWIGGGHGTNGSASSTGLWNVGARYGWVLTRPHGPGLLRGSFEYAVDVVPVFVAFQPANTAYGFGLNPMALKWNLETSGRVAPYLELGGGALFTNHQVPAGTSRVNFTSGGALGMHILRNQFNWSIELRFMHISNAGLATPNPGINTVQLRLGVGRFTHGRRDDRHRSAP
jgi:lipid A 3-O-deacylase